MRLDKRSAFSRPLGNDHDQGGQQEQTKPRLVNVDANAAPWPTMDEAAYYGIAGDIVRAIRPHTEADPVAILVQTLASAGNAIGRDLFGCDRERPYSRIDHLGLVWFIDGGRIVDLDRHKAIIEMGTGARGTFRRRPFPVEEVGPVWEIVR